jgi:hypothetical protein
MDILVAIYVTGVVIGLAVMRDRWAVRIGTALVWPLGVASLALVAVILTASALYLWPVLLLGLILIGATLWLAF